MDQLPWIHPVSTLTTLHAQLLRELQRYLVWVVVRLPQLGKPVHLPRLFAWGWVAKLCLQRASQEAQGKRRHCFHLSSHLLLALSSGIA